MKKRKEKKMKAKLKKIEKREFKTKDGKKFTKIEFTCDVIMDAKGTIKTLKGSYSEDFARRYFEYCGVKTKDLIGEEVEVVLAKRSYQNEKGEDKTITFIKFLNVLRDGKAIIIPKEETEELDF